MNLFSPKEVSQLLKRYEIHPKKSLGQNFLVDGNIIQKIIAAAELKEQDIVLEIGPGLGTLTRDMSFYVNEIFAIELDQRMIDILQETVGSCDNVNIIHNDALKLDYQELISDFIEFSPAQLQCKSKQINPKNLKAVSNLPYYIASPLVLKLAKEKVPLSVMVLMVQREVADRFTASPGSKNYGAVTVLLDCFYEVEGVFNVPKTVFYPQPRVESQVVKLTKRSEAKINDDYQEDFIKFVNQAFNSRRKTLVNNILSIFTGEKSELSQILENNGFSAGIRGEQLTVDEFAQIFKIIYNRIKYS
ncbi:16S rRNA (adenine(1518)-N(6)/adenine(1519)-N(6))-dimethyltransferase RsmA [Natranaerobius thermophilus]|uniref:Ribosomal RNA small subunit methyltransferase A n=1 Tax=Natranaerobius thermophilus (strain ATCC BAA-1301 / DSM 18059 / JW/NM-WN-LF) TaxID=457570 RepID=RSMA_NATTJ|nr:16S rRNA (adenine(1518)-N(6)/adenine(1519)-N(6))-dimethyltransferase RsmA [Natranaerobius thermophilus]B2A3L9.1 RecName: Full=Ribosomal RNA small subunit methyltransferase A; AltName: Full=16S rRNA (adenine(1518)-N(6)/adenine(1519)-N(6))-dimethyltransferase; AltName: Full=16S rRNA dimethyladenosine transferase; AltName: Full=16S rRNA dimethylase; AltName: Full=S-adenosylmethionine-6-N', N'-adenosyl(rRNA) dimethyltransferase [Natranaerobius thermophilus JW/NM-WN-LF]ACB83645.1 dimethyladenosine 